MSKCLFIGCSDAQLPYLRAVKALGYEVVVTDRDGERTDALAAAGLADHGWCCGYDDINGMLDAAEHFAFGPDDKVFTAAAHHAHEAAAAVAYNCGIDYPDPDAIDAIVCKGRLKEAWDNHCIAVPHYWTWKPGDALDPAIPTFIKSDYGKTPRYCWAATEGNRPDVPRRRDQFFRRRFIAQAPIIGTHWRINLTAEDGVVAAFRRYDVDRWVTAETPWWAYEWSSLATGRLVTKADAIVSVGGVPNLLDLGIDPPQRLRIYHEARGEDFAMAYVRQHLTDDGWTLPFPEPGTVINMETRQCES